jgi:hypothetical protein
MTRNGHTIVFITPIAKIPDILCDTGDRIVRIKASGGVESDIESLYSWSWREGELGDGTKLGVEGATAVSVVDYSFARRPRARRVWSTSGRAVDKLDLGIDTEVGT